MGVERGTGTQFQHWTAVQLTRLNAAIFILHVGGLHKTRTASKQMP